MTEINDRLAWHRFLKRVFIADSGVSSKRMSAFILLIAMLFMMFFKYDIEYINTTALLITGLFGLTSGEKIFKKNDVI